MRQSQLFTKTRKHAPKDEVSRNAQLLIRAGFIYKEMAGVYSFLPLGLRVMRNIMQVMREELDEVGAQEMEMSTLQKKEIWEPTDRWRTDLDGGIWFKTRMNDGRELGLAFTHEEAITNIMTNFVSSYKDLPIYAYQFQTKFRNELRAKSGVMRGREFLMKDLYDFSRSKEEHEAFYEKMKEVYKRIFARMGIGERTYLTISNGGTFSKYSFEFQTVCDAGEDVIVYDAEKGVAINKDDFSDEVLSDFNLRKEDFNFTEAKSIEVGDIYELGERFAQALGLTYKDETGKEVPVYMGSYGIGIPRLMGTIVEVLSDEKGIVWPREVAPFVVHLIDIGQAEKSEELVAQFEKVGISVLWDDRSARPGEKFADADLMGMPWRIVLSERSLSAGGVELTNRASDESSTVSIEECIAQIGN